MATLPDIVALSSTGAQCADLTPLQVVVGYVTWLNVFKVFSLVLGAACFVYLFGRSVLNLLIIFARVPIVTYEFTGFALSAALLLLPGFMGVSEPTWFIVPGGILWAGTLALSAQLRGAKPNETLFFGLITLVWGAAAVYYESQIAGFGSVAAFMAFMGFSVVVTPLAYSIGFDDEKAVNRAGGAGLLICAILVFERGFTPGIAQLDIFRTGMQWLGPFIFALSILINANRWYLAVRKQSYLGMQMMAVAAFSALITAGAVFQIEAMLNVGTGFLILYVLEKPTEVEHRSMTSWALTGLLMSAMVAAGVYWAQSNPEIVAEWMPLLAQ